jgi:DNA polymerase-3 subunit beta
VRITADLTHVHFAATDLYQSVATREIGQVDTPGSIAVNNRDLLDRVKTFPEGTVNVSFDDNKLRLTAGKRKHVIPSIDAADFPLVTTTISDARKAKLGALLALVKHAASTDADRAAVNSVLLEGGSNLTATATDGRLLAFSSTPCDNLHISAAIVPLQAVEAICNLVEGAEVEFHWNDRELVVKSGELIFACKLTAAQYPPIRQQLEGMARNPITVGRKALAETIASVAKASSSGDLGGIVKVTARKAQVLIEATGNGEAEDEIDATYEGKEIGVGLQSRYVTDALSTLDGDSVEVSITGDLDPVFFSTPGTSGFRLVMPCRP